MKEMILLGAGASVEAGVPDTYGMTAQIAEQFRQDRMLQRHAHVVSFVIGGLLFQKGIRDEDPLAGGVNVEELFNAVQLLAERETLEAAPFVGSWHSMVQEFDKVKASPPHLGRLYQAIYEGIAREIFDAVPYSPPSFGGRDIDRQLEETIRKGVEAILKNRSFSSYSSNTVGREVGEYMVKIIKDWADKLRHRHPSSRFDFENEFRRALEGVKDRPGEGRIFQETAELMIRALAKIVWIDRETRVQHLKPLLNAVDGEQRLTIASLNYDNGVELLAQSAGTPYTTGIAEWSKTGSFTPSTDGIFLIKLHGSIDWSLRRNQQSAERPMPHSIIRQVNPEVVQKERFRPAVIFGQRNKLTAEGPFLDLLRAFQQELSKCEILTVVGYSFRDDHVNEYISQWLNQSPAHRVRVISRSFRREQSEYAAHLLDFCAARIEPVRENAGAGLTRIFGAFTRPASPTAPATATPSEPIRVS